MQGTLNAAFTGMAILLISWVTASTALCMAFLCVAARPAPRFEKQMASDCEGAEMQNAGVRLQSVNTASVSAEAALPSRYQAA